MTERPPSPFPRTELPWPGGAGESAAAVLVMLARPEADPQPIYRLRRSPAEDRELRVHPDGALTVLDQGTETPVTDDDGEPITVTVGQPFRVKVRPGGIFHVTRPAP